MNLRAAIYARFSSDNQRDESIDAQIRAIEEYSKRNNIDIVKIYSDRAKSATTDKRPDFQQMVDDSALGLFDIVIVHKLDRFSRDKHDSVHYKRKLRKNNVKVVSVIEHLDDSPESIILESVLEGMAEYYSKNLAREVMKGMRENAYQCKHTGGTPPLGYDVDPATQKYVINPYEAEAVKLIFELYLEGHGYKNIINELNARSYKTKKGNPFGKNSIHDLLVNEKYSGTYVFNRASSKDWDGKRNNPGSKNNDDMIRIPGGIPAIVSVDIFVNVQEKMNKNKQQPGAYKAKETYLLSGLIVCGECQTHEGKKYTMMGNVKYSGRGKYKHVTYRCGNRERTKQCDNKEIRREYIENYVIAELQNKIFNNNAISYLVQQLNEYQYTISGKRDLELELLTIQLQEATTQINNIVNAIASGCAQTAFADKLAELEDKKAKSTVTIQEIQIKKKRTVITEDILRGMFSMLKEYLTEKNIPEIRKFIGKYVEKVVVYKDHVDVVFSLCFATGDVAYTFGSSISRLQLIQNFRVA